jgi:GDP/UDP-N,N'-diacetylbacillosamine 2-epimerase (hydrolysing)
MSIAVCIVTGTRAEFGIMRPLLRLMASDESLTLSLIVTGSHLSEHYGNTIDEIVGEGFPIAAKMRILGDSDSRESIAAATSSIIVQFSSFLAKSPQHCIMAS